MAARLQLVGALVLLLAVWCEATSNMTFLAKYRSKRQSGSGAPAHTYICTDLNSYAQDNNDCRRYYICTAGHAESHMCRNGQYYNPHLEACDRDPNFTPVGCIIVGNDAGNPPYQASAVGYQGYGSEDTYVCRQANEQVQDTADCSNFYICTNHNARHYRCPPGQLFDPHLAKCLRNITPQGCHMPDNRAGGSVGLGVNDPCYLRQNQRVQDVNDCSAYIECYNGMSTSRRCSNGQLFNPSTGNCDAYVTNLLGCRLPPNWVSQAQGQTGTFNCPSPNRRFQDTRDCSWYIECVNNQATRRACPSGHFYDPATRTCSFDHEPEGCHRNDDTRTSVGSSGVCNGRTYGNVQDTSDCSAYYQCDYSGQASRRFCASGELFNPSLGYCQRNTNNPGGCQMPYNWGASLRTTTFRCPRTSGEFPYPDDCSMFWRCDNNVAVARRCGRGLLFNPARNYCDYPREVNTANCRRLTDRVSPQGRDSSNNPCAVDDSQVTSQSYHAAHDRICNAFYTCLHGELASTYCTFCGEGMYFDAETTTCLSDMSVDFELVCPGKVMIPNGNKTRATIDGSCWPHEDRPNPHNSQSEIDANTV